MQLPRFSFGWVHTMRPPNYDAILPSPRSADVPPALISLAAQTNTTHGSRALTVSLLASFVFASSTVWSPCLGAPKKLQAHSVKSSHKVSQTNRAAAQSLARQMIKAYGGAEVVRKVAYSGSRSVGKVVDYSTMSDASNSFDCTELSKGDKMRLEINMMGVPETTGFNGKHGWIKQGNRVLETTKLMDMRIKDDLEHDAVLLLVKLLNPETKLELAGRKVLLGRPCQILKVTVNDGSPTLIYVDQTSHLIIKSESEGIDTESGIATLKTYAYEDYRPLSGSRVPYKVTEYSGAKKVSQMALKTIEYIDLDDHIFELPESETPPLAQDEEAIIPFEYLSNEIIIKARANDKEDLLFIVDTGATQSVIDTREAKKLGGFKDSSLTMTTGSGSMALGYMTLSSLSLDSAILKDVHFAVADLSSFSQILGKRPAGLIGADILRRFLVTIDYENQELTLASPDTIPEIAPNAIVLATKPSLGMSGILLEGQLDGHKLPFLVDSGAAFNNISTKLAGPILEHSTVPVLPVGTVEGLDGKKVKIGCLQFKQLKIGSLTVNDPIFSVAPAESNPTGVISTGDLAILGNPFWCRYKMTIDYKGERLILDRSPEVVEAEKLVNQLQKLMQASAKVPIPPMIETTLPSAKSKSQQNRKRNSSATSISKPKATGTQLAPPVIQSPAGSLPPDTIDSLQIVLKEAEEKDLPGVAALCLADIASATAAESLPKVSPGYAKTPTTLEQEQIKSISTLFQEAAGLAERCGAKQVQAQILAKWAVYYMTYLPKPQGLQAAKPLLTKALNCWSTEPSVFTATAVMLRLLHSDPMADKLVDQSLMLDPVDKETLLLKWELAGSLGDKNALKLVGEQLRLYYDIPTGSESLGSSPPR